MSQASSVDSQDRTSPNQSIKPALQAALSSLDVQLDEELSRYRRQKSGRPVMAPRGLGRNQARKSIDLMSVSSKGSKTNAVPATLATTALASTAQAASASQTPEAPNFLATQSDKLASPQQPTVEAAMLDTPEPNSASEPLSFTLAKPAGAAQDANNQTGAKIAEESKEGGSQGNAGGNLVYAPPARQPDDYLASSEQLLRSLSDEEAEVRAERKFLDNVLTPLGVGSMLLLLLSSATVGYIAMNPSSVDRLGLKKFGKPSTPTVAQSPSAPTPSTPKPAIASTVAQGPNLASGEFQELSLDNLSSVSAKPSIAPAPVTPQQNLPRAAAIAVPSPSSPPQADPGRSSNIASALLPQVLESAPLPPPRAVPQVKPALVPPATNTLPSLAPGAAVNPSPAPTTSAATAKVLAKPAPGQKDFYYVVTNYESDRTLEEMRKVAKDAYVVNIPQGPRIALGAFTNPAEAETRVQQLQKTGIAAEVYHP